MHVILAALFCLFAACSEESDPEINLLPDSGVRFTLFPNDEAVNDSIAANLAHGVKLQLHPNASYELSFDRSGAEKAPVLQLYRLYEQTETQFKVHKVRELEGEFVGDRIVYRFVCEENEMIYWATSLLDGETFYRGPTKNVKLTGEGAYSDHMSINLVAVGKILPTKDSVDVDSLANLMLKDFRRYYSTIKVDTLYVRYAHEHPTLGKKYPADEPWRAGYSSDDMYLSELGGWPEANLRNALDIVYMHRIEEEGSLGFAALFSGNMGGGKRSTVIVGNRIYAPSLGGEVPLTSKEIVESALHETGHFFGLRHTTTTPGDWEAEGDYSNLEDGIEETPSCINLILGGYMSVNDDEIGGVARKYYFDAKAFEIEDCPDASNVMFPAATELPYEGFSQKQLEIVRKNLMIFPH